MLLHTSDEGKDISGEVTMGERCIMRRGTNNAKKAEEKQAWGAQE
jgi:hypothetical protein